MIETKTEMTVMESFEPKKLALFRIWQILKEHSDDKHPLTQEAIAEHLERDYGIVVERKAIGRNLSLLKEAGVEIASERNGSYLAVREFEDSELHMLIDGVLGSRYIAARHSEDLIDRICSLSNRYFRSRVKHIHSADEWGKTENQSLFYNIELIDNAIEDGKQVHYIYNKYGMDKKLHKTSEQYVSPYLMILHNQHYYLMAYSEYWGNMVFHRLDHMTNMTVVDQPAVKLTSVKGYENGINYKELSSALPYMYTDKPERIEFLADVSAIDQVVDWFGSEARITKTDDEKKVLVNVKTSPNAMAYWALQYIDHVEILSPPSLRERIKDSLANAMEKYR